jgi:hypothetical protein
MGADNKTNYAVEGKMEEFRSFIMMGQTAIRYQIIINGGACIAVLAFIGGIFDKNESLARGLSTALMSFGLGVLAGALVSGFSWISQRRFYYGNEAAGEKWNCICVAVGIWSYLFFIIGGLITFLLLRNG